MGTRRYATRACNEAIRHPGRWVTVSNIPQAKLARERILRNIGPRVLLQRQLPGRFLCHQWRTTSIRLMFLWPTSDPARDASLIELDKIRLAVRNAKAPRRTTSIPPQEHTQTPEGSNDDT